MYLYYTLLYVVQGKDIQSGKKQFKSKQMQIENNSHFRVDYILLCIIRDLNLTYNHEIWWLIDK